MGSRRSLGNRDDRSAPPVYVALVLLIVCLLDLPVLSGAKTWKACHDNDFCNRNRFLPPYTALYSVEKAFSSNGPWASAPIRERFSSARFELQTAVYSGGVTRIRIVEPSAKRHEVPDVLTSEHASRHRKWESIAHQRELRRTRLVAGDVELHVDDSPLALRLFRNGREFGNLNANGLLAIEHTRLRGREQNDTDAMWSESFGGATDSKPHGPQALSVDASFPHASNVYGLPDRLQKLSLPSTIDSDGNPTAEPYRLYNLDIPHFESDNNFALYGSVPFAIAHSAQNGSAGLFFLNSAEMYVDVRRTAWDGEKQDEGSGNVSDTQRSESGINLRWLAESGIVDLFFLPGPSPKDVSAQYAMLTGSTDLPQEFALGFHQCRWNYRDQKDLLAVNNNFDNFDMPADVLWLDIEHTDKKKYITWDTRLFPDPQAMMREVQRTNRKVVTIVDPHVKREDGYWIHKEASSKGYYVKSSDGKSEYKGHCWPGEVSYLDVTRKDVREWFQSQLSPKKYNGSVPDVHFLWNDMNEPSVFTGPEVTMPKDLQHAGGWEHRDVHNVYGHHYAMVTSEGLRKRSPGERPFVLTRAHFAGTQRHAAVWTGDNTADWPYLRYSVSQLMRLNIAGIAFSGADVGGFFYTPRDELMIRWFQLGIYNPFFRSHAHHETARQEPWLWDEPTRSRIKAALRERYTLIPYMYTLFAENSQRGTPVLRPPWFEFPNDSVTMDQDDHFMLGNALLVRPILEEGVSSVHVHFPGNSDELWYDVLSGNVDNGQTDKDVEVTMDTIPTYQRGGTIIARKEKPRRSVASQHGDPYTLYVALDKAFQAEGRLYMDDGHSYRYENQEFAWLWLSFAEHELTAVTTGNFKSDARIERIVIMGEKHDFKAATAYIPGIQASSAHPERSTVRPTVAGSGGAAVLIRTPCLRASGNWSLVLSESVSSQSSSTRQCSDQHKQRQMNAQLRGADHCEEPGSSECPNAKILCRNEGFFPSDLPVSMAEDGVCDCCDGSDEPAELCSNHCAHLAQKRKDELNKRIETLLRGLKARAGYAAEPQIDQEQKKTDAEQLSQQIRMQEKEVTRLEQKKRESEAEEEKERKLMKKRASMQKIEAEYENGDFEVEDDAVELDDMEYDEDGDDSAYGTDEVSESSDEIEHSEAEEVQEEGFEDFESEDEEDELDSHDEEIAMDEPEEAGHNDHNENVLTKEEEEIARKYIKPAEWDDEEDGIWEPPNATAEAEEARSAHKSAKGKLDDMKERKDEAEKLAWRNYGRDKALSHLDGICLELSSPEYSYKVCPYGEAHQSNVRLGTFEALQDEEDTMLFTGGQPCGGGPRRQLTLVFECGESDELMSVEEPEMCKYHAVAQSPIGCFQSQLESAHAELEQLNGSMRNSDQGSWSASPIHGDEL